MKTLILLLFISTPAFADWSKADTTREAAFMGLLYADYNQTMQQARNGWKNFNEQNILYGTPKPGVGRVNNYHLAAVVGHYAIAKALPDNWRSKFQNGTIGLQIVVVGRWYHFGVKVEI